MQRGERANAERHVAEVILGQVEGTDGRSYHVERQVLELVVGEVENGKVERPVYHIRDLGQLVVRKSKLFQPGQLEQTAWNGGQLIESEVKLHNLHNDIVVL